MWKLLRTALLCAIFHVTLGQDTADECAPIEVGRYVVAECTNGNKTGSKCTFSCDDGYELVEGKFQRCQCKSNGKCKWKGREAKCEFKVVVPVVCDRPDFRRASYGVVERTPRAAIFKFTIRPTAATTNGWSVALIMHNPLPETVGFASGHAKLKATSGDRKIFTFVNRNFNADISSLGAFTFFVVVSGLEEDTRASAFTAMAAFYPKKIDDASCIQTVSPVRPLPTTTPAPTTSPPSTTPPTTPPSTTPPSTTPPSTTPPSTTPPSTTPPSTTPPSTPSTTPPTSPPSTTSSTASTTPLASDCEVVSNEGANPGYKITNPGWNQNGWTWQAHAQKFADGRPLANWQMKIEFDKPVNDLSVYVATKHGPYADGRVWILKPMSYNIQPTQLQILIMPETSVGQSAANAIMTFCRNGAEASTDATGSVTSSVTTTTTTAAPVATTTRAPSVVGRCATSSRFQLFPLQSTQTDATNFISSPLSAIFTTIYDYNEVLHMSLLFYEAQRAGKLPADNRIGWRGDSGMKDGCEVNLDLSKGYYDAGDNVKFGFPMAWTITTIAWGAIEFKGAYEAAGEYRRVLDMIKWATDYFVAAHPSPNVFYAQVGDGEEDHSRWERPEDRKEARRLYAIDANNGGSDIAAETAAALAAASIVFRDVNATYADILLQHARDLYTFADTYRKPYHQSVPGVDKFYKSWSGYKDELLWGAAWLHKATGEDSYLNTVKDEYDSMGAGAVPPEFSWDNKYAGVQILMSEFTQEAKYREDVENFMQSAMDIPTTPKGMTWKQKWGPNRYAANFAAIAVMAAELQPPMAKRHEYVMYARTQINYLLGQNERDASYVVGYGVDPPRSPHHRASSCPGWTQRPVPACGFDSLNSAEPNPHVLYGALVGGPDLEGVYDDDRKDYVANEVATDYNAGFQTAVAGLQYIELQAEGGA